MKTTFNSKIKNPRFHNTLSERQKIIYKTYSDLREIFIYELLSSMINNNDTPCTCSNDNYLQPGTSEIIPFSFSNKLLFHQKKRTPKQHY